MAQGFTRLRAGARALTLLSVAALAAACFPIKFTARMPLPEPLITRMPYAVALHVPADFAAYTQKEKRDGLKWEIALGKAHAAGFTQLLTAMFDRVIVVDSVEAASRAGQPVRVILEPAIDEYAFVTSRETGSSFFAVSIKYRMGIYTPDGKLADSWAFTGYGSAPTSGMSDEDTLSRATTLALRDAAAKLAVEFRDQEVVRELLAPDPATVDAPAAPPTENGTAPAPQVAPEQRPAPESQTPPTEKDEPGAAPTTTVPAMPEVPVQSEPQAPAAPPPARAPSEEKPAPTS